MSFMCVVYQYFCTHYLLLEDVFCFVTTSKLKIPNRKSYISRITLLKRFWDFRFGQIKLCLVYLLSIQSTQLQNVWTEFKNRAFARGGPGLNKK